MSPIVIPIVLLLVSIFMIVVASIALNCFYANGLGDGSNPRFVFAWIGVVISVLMFIIAGIAIRASRGGMGAAQFAAATKSSYVLMAFMIIFSAFFIAVAANGMQCFDQTRQSNTNSYDQARIDNEYNIMIAGIVASSFVIILCFVKIGLTAKEAKKRTQLLQQLREVATETADAAAE